MALRRVSSSREQRVTRSPPTCRLRRRPALAARWLARPSQRHSVPRRSVAMNAFKGALAAPLFFLGLVLTAAGSVTASPMLWLGALGAFAGASLLWRSEIELGMTPLPWAVCGFAAWIVANDFLNSPYTAAGIFHPALLAAGFLFVRTLDAKARGAVLRSALAGMAWLALWALLQAAWGQGRAHALFETPNTLATVLNLALAPLLFRIAYGDERRSLFGLAILLMAALATTLSRGGAIALAAGLLATSLLYFRRPSTAGVVRVCGVACSGVIVAGLAVYLPRWTAHTAAPSEGAAEMIASTLGPTVSSRAELYRLALGAAGEHPWLGTGYLGFKAFFDAGQLQVPSYAAGHFTYF